MDIQVPLNWFIPCCSGGFFIFTWQKKAVFHLQVHWLCCPKSLQFPFHLLLKVLLVVYKHVPLYSNDGFRSSPFAWPAERRNLWQSCWGISSLTINTPLDFWFWGSLLSHQWWLGKTAISHLFYSYFTCTHLFPPAISSFLGIFLVSPLGNKRISSLHISWRFLFFFFFFF